MLSIAVCEDMARECYDISRQIHTILNNNGVEHTIKEYLNGKEFLEANCAFDMVFLDIQMEGQDGLKTAKLLRKKDSKCILVFVTAHEEYVYEAFDVEAFQYLLKPLDSRRLARVLNGAVEKIKNQPEGYLIINRNREIIKVYLSEIQYFEIRGRIIKVHEKDGVLEYYGSLHALEEKLMNQPFYRCHKSYLIHLGHIKQFHKEEILMDNGEQVMISKRRYDGFYQAMLDYAKKEGGIV